MEEERRLCYVGMTRAMDTLVMTRARSRRRYGNDMPESTVASRFLEEIPARLVEDLGSPGFGGERDEYGGYRSNGFNGRAFATPYPQREVTAAASPPARTEGALPTTPMRTKARSRAATAHASMPRGASAQSRSPRAGTGRQPCSAGVRLAAGLAISLEINATRAVPKWTFPTPTGKTGLGKNARVRHPKYGEGMIVGREGDGDDAKLTVSFTGHGVKKLVEKFAQLERL